MCVWTQQPSGHSSCRDPANAGVQCCASQSLCVLRAVGGRTGFVISSRRLWIVAPSSSPCFTGNAPAPTTQSAATRSALAARVVERIFLLRTKTDLPQLARRPSRSRSEMRHERAQRAPTLTERPICQVSMCDLLLQRGKFASAKNDLELKVQFSAPNACFESFKIYSKFGRFGSAARVGGVLDCF